MDYPNDFDIPSFPAGKTIAFSRSISIWILIIFFLIISACGFLLLGRYFEKNYPFLISVDPFTDDWVVVAYPEESKTVSQYRYVQEKLINDFVVNWFTISEDTEKNELRWYDCSVEECKAAEQFNPSNIKCAISCNSDKNVFTDFQKKVLPDYRAMINIANETWTVKNKSFTPIIVSENEGKWQVYVSVNSKVMGEFKILIFADIARDINNYPATFGYYVKQFNAYRIRYE